MTTRQAAAARTGATSVERFLAFVGIASALIYSRRYTN